MCVVTCSIESRIVEGIGIHSHFKNLKHQRLGKAKGRIRFEATTGHRALESQAIPTNLKSFLKFHDWFESVHKEPLGNPLSSEEWINSFDQNGKVQNVDFLRDKIYHGVCKDSSIFVVVYLFFFVYIFLSHPVL